jgi:hypothetical protein
VNFAFKKVIRFNPCNTGIGINIHGCQPNLEMAIYVLKSGNDNDIIYCNECTVAII